MCSSKVVFVCLFVICSFSQAFCKDVSAMFGENCNTGYSVTCFKLDIVSFIEKFSEKRETILMPGISLVQEVNSSDPKTSEIFAEIARSFPNNAEKRLDGYLLTRLGNLLQSLTLKWSLLDPATVEDARSAFTGRKGKIGKKGGLETLLAAGLMMKGTLMTIAMGALALLAGKALLTGLMALMLSAIVGLKSLAGGGKSTTYEIVAKPVYQNSHSHSISHEDIHSGGGHPQSGYGSYGRSINFNLPEHLTKSPK